MKPYLTIMLSAITVCSFGQVANNSLPVPKLVFDEKGELAIAPSTTSSKNDFDFFIGKWKLQNKVLKKNPDKTTSWNEFESTQEMYTILNGQGNIDNFLAERNGNISKE